MTFSKARLKETAIIIVEIVIIDLFLAPTNARTLVSRMPDFVFPGTQSSQNIIFYKIKMLSDLCRDY